jgi:outer membrane protein TolC
MAEVESAYASWATYRERAAAIRATLLLLASHLLAIAHNLYFEEKDGLLNLFEARRTRREIRQKYFKVLLDYHDDRCIAVQKLNSKAATKSRVFAIQPP